MNHRHCLWWGELPVFAGFQHLYRCAVYAIVSDIQADASYVSILVRLEILNFAKQCFSCLQVDVIHHYFFDSLSKYQYASVFYI